MKLVLATRNLGKVRELTTMLSENRQPTADSRQPLIEVLSLQDFPDAPEVIEDGVTYQENAAKKATVIADYTGYLTLADDSGLEVDALDGAPGIHAKRWAGENATDAERMQKLLGLLEGVSNRRGRFVAAIAIASPTQGRSEGNSDSRNAVTIVSDSCAGHITTAPAGESGFGYDPVFVPIGYDKTFAELGEAIKNRISHRSKALRLAITHLNSYIAVSSR